MLYVSFLGYLPRKLAFSVVRADGGLSMTHDRSDPVRTNQLAQGTAKLAPGRALLPQLAPLGQALNLLSPHNDVPNLNKNRRPNKCQLLSK